MHTRAIIVTLAVMAFAAGHAFDNDNTENPVVFTSLGRVKGSRMTSRLGRQFNAFRGMRFAEPPTGNLRFKPAVPIAPWKNVLDASQEGPACPQLPGRIPLQSEDCLRLNVYTRELPSRKSKEIVKKPVLVFFHPGGFYGFSGQSSVFGPEYFMDEDIVLVLVNYRLASLGFLSTGDALAPGNLGLKDQVVALRWVQKNIASFGGDPNCVTISGYSSGGWSVSLHLVSPMSKGLFHRAIVMSGSAIYQKPLPPNQMDLAIKQAKFVDCPSDNSADIIRCLNTKSASEIAETLPRFAEWYGDPISVWTPVVETDYPGVERFLTAQPADLIRQGKFYEVPVMTGITKDEFGGVVVAITEQTKTGNTSILDDLNANFEKIAPIAFLYERDTPRSIEIGKAIKQFYFKGQPISLKNVDAVGQIYADGVIGFSIHRFAKVMAQASKLPVYYYEFTYQGSLSFATWPETKKPYGVAHHDDLLYLFHIGWFPKFEKNAPENRIIERQTAMWANFAKTGQPIPCDNEKFANVTWTPYTNENKAYMDMGDELVMKRNLFGARMNLWDRLFPLPPVIQTRSQWPASQGHRTVNVLRRPE